MSSGLLGSNTTSVGSLYNKPPYQVSHLKPLSTTSANFNIDSPNPPKGENKSKKNDDGIEYTITFKRGPKIKDVIKQVYTLYGPVFVVCHILVSLTSLGFFCSLILLSVDLTQVIPDAVWQRIGERFMDTAEKGGKFFVAYAIHKLLLPARLGISILLTRHVSRLIQSWRKK